MSARPQTKVTAGTVAGAVTTVLTWALSEWVGLDVPTYVAAAVTLVITAAAAYIVPNRD